MHDADDIAALGPTPSTRDGAAAGVPDAGLSPAAPAVPCAVGSPDPARDHIEHLQRALDSRTDISVAIGILVERNSWTRQEAFDWLVALSQNTNTKVVTLARTLVQDTENRG